MHLSRHRLAFQNAIKKQVLTLALVENLSAFLVVVLHDEHLVQEVSIVVLDLSSSDS